MSRNGEPTGDGDLSIPERIAREWLEQSLEDASGLPTAVFVALGPMFSGKTSTLLCYLEKCRAAGLRVLAVKPAIDRRYGEGSVISHDGRAMPCMSVSSMAEVDTEAFDVVGIDEGQFVTDLPDFCQRLALLPGKRVAVSMLRGDWRCEPWEVTSRLVPLATEIAVLKANCDVCGRLQSAVYTAKKCCEGMHGGKIEVGGAEKYFPVCPLCYGAYRKGQE